MKCPTDGTTLVMSERSGVEIDYCPDCRGVWLDRGELDKILERAESEVSRSPAPQREERYTPRPSYDDRRYDDSNRYRGKKKSHWLGELFD